MKLEFLYVLVVSAGNGQLVTQSTVVQNGRVSVAASLQTTTGHIYHVCVCLTKHHAMKTYWGVEVYLYALLTSALYGGEWSASRPGRLTQGKETLVPIG
jgi:hypothetical protein